MSIWRVNISQTEACAFCKNEINCIIKVEMKIRDAFAESFNVPQLHFSVHFISLYSISSLPGICCDRLSRSVLCAPQSFHNSLKNLTQRFAVEKNFLALGWYFYSSWIQRAPQPSNLPCLWLVVVVSSAEDSLVSPLRLFLPLSPSPQPASTVILAGTFNANLEENTIEKSKRLKS